MKETVVLSDANAWRVMRNALTNNFFFRKTEIILPLYYMNSVISADENNILQVYGFRCTVT
jgi:hypothetical protein